MSNSRTHSLKTIDPAGREGRRREGILGPINNRCQGEGDGCPSRRLVPACH